MARSSARRQQYPKARLTTVSARPASPDFETIEPVSSGTPAVTPRDPAGDQPLSILLAETSLWRMGMTALLLAPMAAAAVAVAPVMLASKLIPTRLLT